MRMIRRARDVLADRLEPMTPEATDAWAARGTLLDECDAFLRSLGAVEHRDDRR